MGPHCCATFGLYEQFKDFFYKKSYKEDTLSWKSHNTFTFLEIALDAV